MGCGCGQKKRTVWNSRQAKERQQAAREGRAIMELPETRVAEPDPTAAPLVTDGTSPIPAI
jgi:hypothetical protein